MMEIQKGDGVKIRQYKEGEYDSDSVGRLEFKNNIAVWGVNTCKAPDTGRYETGWADSKNDYNTKIVEEYNTIQEARAGHRRWAIKMLNGKIK